MRRACHENGRGQARLPDHELHKVKFGFLIERPSRPELPSYKQSSPVGKVGLPPLPWRRIKPE